MTVRCTSGSYAITGGPRLPPCARGADRVRARRAGPGRRRHRPVVATGLGETGPTRGITGFRVRFTRALNPAEARSIGNYAFVGISANGTRTPIALKSATYTRGARSVRVKTVRPLDQGVFRRLSIRLKGRQEASPMLADGSSTGTGTAAPAVTRSSSSVSSGART